MNILAIETSCDETALALIATTKSGGSFRVLSHIVLSQVSLHADWGGVVPILAKREHEKALVPLLMQVLKEIKSEVPSIKYKGAREKSENLDTLYTIHNTILNKNCELLEQFEKNIVNLSKPKIDLISVTYGPGLEPALWVGVNFARALSALWNIPLVGINHMEGHIVSALISETNAKRKVQSVKPIAYPALALLVSGGHTELVLIKKPLQYKIIGETRDDAAGEAFDKVARTLGLGYPGGPAIAAEVNLEAELRRPVSKLPRPMINTKDYDFSFSGLKTAVLYLVRNLEKQSVAIKTLRPAIAKEFQNAVVDVLVTKTIRAAKQYGVNTILLGGGVAANTELRTRLEEAIKKNSLTTLYLLPDTCLTGDNALMIAVAAIPHAAHAKKTTWKTLRPDANLSFPHL